MGFRFRKSTKIGPVRLNFSKKGVGWSVGGPGYRYTKKAGGKTRQTYSIPGTGLSYVKDSKKTKRNVSGKSESVARGEQYVPEEQEVPTTKKWTLWRVIKTVVSFGCMVFCVMVTVGGIFIATSRPQMDAMDIVLIAIFGAFTIGFGYIFIKTYYKK